mmetsp:Transcript_14807/g.43894  ORF Transcript_14807/g.43894 Transcript_14807/m.43894 type:complete len:397 (-) Transcript_14807:148-1338(-)
MAPAIAKDDGAKMKVKKDVLAKAVKALHQVVAKQTADTNPLFGSSAETMTLQFTLSQIPDRRKMRPVMIPLPHPMWDEKSEVCFFAKDPQKTYKELLMKKCPIPGITKVIGLDKLRRNYKSLEAKKALADAFDLFLCDSRIVEMMPRALGNMFYQQKRHKVPLPVRLRVADPKPAIERALGGTALRVPSGPCLGVKIGRCGMPEEHLVENALAVIRGVVDNVKGNPVQSIVVQATNSVALPVFKRPAPPGGSVDLKKYHSDVASSSAASETGASGVSETEGGSEVEYGDLPSDAGETISTRDTASDVDTAGDLSLDSHSELDSEAGDVDLEDKPVSKDQLPLLQGLKSRGKRKAAALASKAAPEAAPEATKPAAKPDSAMMPPPKKLKKGKAKAKA